jgi:hypothetical protein
MELGSRFSVEKHRCCCVEYLAGLFSALELNIRAPAAAAVERKYGWAAASRHRNSVVVPLAARCIFSLPFFG